MNRRAVIAGVVVLILLVVGGLSYRAWVRSPTYSLRQIQRSIEDHDVGLFRKHVDLDSMVTRAVDDLMSAAMAETDSPESAGAALGSALGAGLVQLMKPRFVDAITEQVERFVESGKLGTGGPDAEKIAFDLEAAESLLTNYQGVIATERSGKVTVATVGLRHAELDLDLEVELTLRELGGYWQLAELSNLAEVLERIEAAQEKALAKANAPIRKRLHDALAFARISKTNHNDRWDIDREVWLRVAVRNESDRPINSYSATLKAKAKDGGELVQQIRIRDDDPIAPGDTGGGTWTLDVNRFDQEDMRLFEMSQEDLEFTISFNEITFGNGEAVKVFESYSELRDSLRQTE